MIENDPVDPDNAAIGSRIAEARAARGWSQKALADAAGRSRSAVATHEGGFAAPSIRDVVNYAEAMGVDPAWMAFGPKTGPDDDSKR